jgi:tape measure domain-containing protein
MAITAEELRILVKAETKQAVDNLNRFKKTSKSTTLDLKQMAKQLIGPLSITAGLALLSRTIQRSIVSSVKYAASIEQMGVAFDVLLGSAEKAEEVLRDLREFSIKTPFTFEELAPAAKRLLAFGTAAEDVVDVMRDLGNASAGNAQTLDRIVDAYGKVQAKGRASLEELNRFTEAGVPLMRQLAEDLELTNEELFKFISAGKLGFDEVNTALQNLTRGEGQFAGMLEAQSKTLEGAMSTLKGGVQELGRLLVDPFLPAITDAVTQTSNLVAEIIELKEVLNLRKTLEESKRAWDAGVGTFQDEINAQRLKVIDFTEELNRLNKKIDIRIDFLGAEAAQMDPLVLDMLEKAAKLQQSRVNAQAGLQSLLDQQSMEATAKAAEEAEMALLQTVETINLIPVETVQAVRPTVKALRTLQAGFQDIGDSVVDLTGPIDTRAIWADLAMPIIETLDVIKVIPQTTEPAIESLKTLAAGFTEISDSFMEDGPIDVAKALETIEAYLEQLDAAEKKLLQMAMASDILNSSIASVTSLLAGSFVDAMEQIGSALHEGATSAEAMGNAFEDMGARLLKALPQLLLNAGLAVMQIPDPSGTALAIGLGLVAASGLIALGSALFGVGETDPISTNTDPNPERTIRESVTSRGDTVTVINGNVFVRDEFDSSVVAANSAAAGNR